MLLLSVAKAVWDSRSGLDVIDLPLLARAGAGLFGAQWLDVFSDAGVQVGPITLALVGFLWRVAGETGVDLELLFSLMVQPAVVLSCLWLVGQGAPEAGGRLAQGVVGLLLVVWEVPWNAYVFGHPSEFLIPILWLWGGRLVRRGHPHGAGAVIALSVGLKAWGVLGLPLLFMAMRARDQFRGVFVALVGVVLLYGPFFLFGEVETFGYRWVVGEGSGAAVLLPPGAGFGWLPRLLQGGFALGIGSAVALTARKRSELFAWTPALAIVGVRLATDPLDSHYYWLAAQAVLLVASGWFVGTRSPVPALVLIFAASLTFLASTLSIIAVALLLVALAMTAALLGDRLEPNRMPLRRGQRTVDSAERPLKPGP